MRSTAPWAMTQYRHWPAAEGRHNDHLALALGEAKVLFHQRVVIVEEGAELGWAVRQHQKHVGHEAGLLLHGKDAVAHVLGHVGRVRVR
jgi:hypothetical protein